MASFWLTGSNQHRGTKTKIEQTALRGESKFMHRVLPCTMGNISSEEAGHCFDFIIEETLKFLVSWPDFKLRNNLRSLLLV